MVVARFAMNKTRNATRITTTPPTVIRSQKSDLSRMRLSLFRDICPTTSPTLQAVLKFAVTTVTYWIFLQCELK